MIKITYRELFSFAVKNTFYTNGQYPITAGPAIGEDFDIIIPYDTKRIIRESGLVYCKKSNGFAMMAEVNETMPQIFSTTKKINKNTKLTFFLSLRNNGLLSFSDVPFKDLLLGEMYYFNNLGINTDLRDNLRVSSLPTTSLSDKLTRIQASNYTYEYAGLISSDVAKIVSQDSNDFLVPETATQINGKTLLSFDLSGLTEGRYQLVISGTVKDTFFYAAGQKSVFCVFEVFFDHTQNNYQILEPDFSLLPHRPKYTLTLQRRKTFWRYIVNMDRNILASPSVEISDLSTGFAMTAPNTKQVIFTSVSKIDSMEEPLLRGSPPNLIKVILKDGLSEKIGNLPVPNTSVIKEESNQFYSEIIINI